MRVLRETRPRVLLAEMDRIAKAFGSSDRHPAPSSRARSLSSQLVAIGDAVLAGKSWTVEGPTLWLGFGGARSASFSPMPSYAAGRSALSTMLFVWDNARTELVANAEACRYKQPRGAEGSEVWSKLQPLSTRSALAEARYLEDLLR